MNSQTMKPYQTPTLTELGDVETLTGKVMLFGDGTQGTDADPFPS